MALGHGRWCGKFLRFLDAIPGATRVLVGYRRPFATLDDARQSIAQAPADGHSTTRNCALHAGMSTKPRPSDYSAFYYLSEPAKDCKRVFDLGGNVGNLFYYYPSFVPFPRDLEWTVLDLPDVMAEGRRLATQRSATALQFTERFSDADGADLLIVSGSMHYLNAPLSDMISDLKRRPRYVLINRTPLTDGAAFATIQDAVEFRVACMVSNRSNILQLFASLGYRLVGDWDAAELSVPLPLHPKQTVHAYSGLFFYLPS
jgi:putative methyltransferase (TIGR04325 family)